MPDGIPYAIITQPRPTSDIRHLTSKFVGNAVPRSVMGAPFRGAVEQSETEGFYSLRRLRRHLPQEGGEPFRHGLRRATSPDRGGYDDFFRAVDNRPYT